MYWCTYLYICMYMHIHAHYRCTIGRGRIVGEERVYTHMIYDKNQFTCTWIIIYMYIYVSFIYIFIGALLAEAEPWKEEVFMLEIIAALQAIKILYKVCVTLIYTHMCTTCVMYVQKDLKIWNTNHCCITSHWDSIYGVLHVDSYIYVHNT